MNYCVIHGGISGNHKCSFCGNRICYECYNKLQIKRHGKKLGFCSDICKSQYIDRVKKYKQKTRKKSLKYLFIGSLSIILGFIVMGLVVNFYPETKTIMFIPKFILDKVFWALVFGGIAFIIYAFLAFFRGVDPDIYT
ncbi:MAG: hypothetical protein K8R79_08450 [Calditrichales bacterium]|nr:hypothetical protein [Calditrichales bacterium]